MRAAGAALIPCSEYGRFGSRHVHTLVQPVCEACSRHGTFLLRPADVLCRCRICKRSVFKLFSCVESSAAAIHEGRQRKLPAFDVPWQPYQGQSVLSFIVQNKTGPDARLGLGLDMLKKNWKNFDLNGDKELTALDLKYLLGSLTKKMGSGG